MRIERLHPDDWHRYRQIRLVSLADAPDAFGTTFAAAAELTEMDWRAQLAAVQTFVAVVGGMDAGTVRGVADEQDQDSACLISMWVAPAFRGQGVGDRLIGAVIDWARSAGFARLVLDVADANQAAIGLYARMGFEPTGETGTLPPPRTHVLEHRRKLLL